MTQTSFAEPSDRDLETEALVIHRRSSSTDRKQLLLFVHGLGGTRYGRRATWGHYPGFVFEDFPDADVGLYSYSTLWHRWRFWTSIDIEIETHTFADLLRQVRQYEHIVLLGHSLGGLLCQGAIAHLLRHQGADTLSRISGLLLMATPQTGSQRVPGWMSWLSRDFRALKPHGRFVRDIQDTLRAAQDQKGLRLQQWAVLGDSDFWVDELSASLGLPERQKLMIRGSHTSIVKPFKKESDGFQFVRSAITACLTVRNKLDEDDKDDLLGRASDLAMFGIRDKSSIYTQITLRARIDEDGNYFGHYVRAGRCVDGPVSRLRISTASDSFQAFADLGVLAIDRREGKGDRRLEVEQVHDGAHKKRFDIHLGRTLREDDEFRVEWRERWNRAIRLDHADGDFLRAYECPGGPSLLFSHNVEFRLSGVRYYLVIASDRTELLEHDVVVQSDGSVTYSYRTPSCKEGVYVFAFDGVLLDSKGERTARRLGRIDASHPFGEKRIVISTANESDLNSSLLLEMFGRKATTHTVGLTLFKLPPFRRGFLVAKYDNRIIGYLESILWNPFTFDRCDEIDDSALHLDVSGSHLFIRELLVEPEFRQHGLGRALIRAAEHIGRDHLASYVHLACSEDLKPIFEKLGYREMCVLSSGRQGKREVLMAMALP